MSNIYKPFIFFEKYLYYFSSCFRDFFYRLKSINVILKDKIVDTFFIYV